MFRSEARIGLTASNELMSTIESEADLFAVFEDNAEADDITAQSSCDTDSIDSRTAQITAPIGSLYCSKRTGREDDEKK